MRTFTMGIYGTERAEFVARQIIRSSQWFEFTPLPFNEYEFKVKEENGGLLQQAVTQAWDVFPRRPEDEPPVEDED